MLKIHATAQRKFERNRDSYTCVTVIYSFRLMKHENGVNVESSQP